MFRVKKTGNHKTLEKTQTYFWFQVKDIKISNIFYKIQKIKKKVWASPLHYLDVDNPFCWNAVFLKEGRWKCYLKYIKEYSFSYFLNFQQKEKRGLLTVVTL